MFPTSAPSFMPIGQAFDLTILLCAHPLIDRRPDFSVLYRTILDVVTENHEIFAWRASCLLDLGRELLDDTVNILAPPNLRSGYSSCVRHMQSSSGSYLRAWQIVKSATLDKGGINNFTF